MDNYIENEENIAKFKEFFSEIVDLNTILIKKGCRLDVK